MRAPGPADRWWTDEARLSAFVSDLIADELSRLRPGAPLPPRPWPGGLDIGETGLGADSLELLSLATALAQALEMHRTGVEDYLLARRTLADWTAIAAASLRRHDSGLTFRTSGSTGEPKPCAHALADLEQEAAGHAALFQGARRIVALVPSHHIYGFLFTVLLPARLGVPVVDLRGSSPVGVAGRLRPGDLVIGHPAFWSLLVRARVPLPEDVVAVTSTAPCPPELGQAVLAAGVARLVEIYGSSETAGVGWRDEPGGAYALLEFWRHAAGGLERVRADGSLDRRPAPDRLQMLDDSRFHIQGRLDEAVQVGGINVFPAHVRDRLLEHPDVADAAVRLMRPEEGARLKAFVVPRDPRRAEALRAELHAWCEANLPTPQRPKAFAFGPELPRTPLGKAADWPILQDA